MKRYICLVTAFCVVLCVCSGAWAQEHYRSLKTRDGVEVTVEIDPLGPNNQIAAYIRFVNRNDYKVDIAWTPVITCPGEPVKQGYGAPFSIDPAASYEVKLWRSSACRVGSIRDLTVNMEVRAAGSAE